MKYWLILLAMAGLGVGVSGCASAPAKPEASVALNAAERAALLKRAKAPQVFGLTAYASERGAVFSGAFRVHEGDAGRIAFVSGKDTTTPVVALAGGSVMALVDATSAESWLTVEAVPEVRAVALAAPNPFEAVASHVYDPVGGFAAVVPTLVMDDIYVENGVFFIRNARGPLDLLTRWEREPYLDAVLGADYLRAFQFVRISLSGRFFFFSATQGYPANDRVIARLPVLDGYRGIAVEAMIDGSKQPLLIDMAGDFELAVERPESRTVRQVSLGDVVFRQVEVDALIELGMSTNQPARIGRQLLERFDLVINNRGRELLIERPPETP
jgi:hypothetical protein